MPRIYAIFAAQRLYLRCAADGSIEFTTTAAAADDVLIETPYDEAPLTLAEAATKATPVVLLFPDGSASTGLSPLHPKDNLIAGGNTLAASRVASQIGRRWTVRAAAPITEAEGNGYHICLSIAADHTLAVSADSRPILAGSDTVLAGQHQRVFYEDEPEGDGDYCESCDKPVEKGERWCCHGCRCDVEPGYERSYR